MKGSTPTLLTLNGKNFTLLPSKKTTTAGGWVTMDANSGKILWSTANPSNSTSAGPITVSNDVLFAGSTHPKGPIYAMNAKTGEILWTYETEATVYGGMSVSNRCIYVGNGYTLGLGGLNPSYTAGTSLLVFAFCLSWVLMRENIYTYYIYWANNKAWNCFFFFFFDNEAWNYYIFHRPTQNVNYIYGLLWCLVSRVQMPLPSPYLSSIYRCITHWIYSNILTSWILRVAHRKMMLINF